MFSSSVRAVVSLGLVTVIWFTLAPIFGLTVFGTRRSSTSDYYNYYTNTAGGYYDYSDPGYQYESPYYAQGRSLNLGDDEKRGIGALARIGRVMNRSGS